MQTFFIFRIWVLILLLCGVYTRAAAEQDLLEPDRAFEFSSEFKDAHVLRLSWRIADGYYLYRQKFQFVSQTPGIDIGVPVFPGGQFKTDKQFGSVEIYRDQLTLELPIRRLMDKPVGLSLQVTFQGCADIGFCYLPIWKSISLPAEP